MKSFRRLINRLHRVFNRSPKNVQVMSVTFGCATCTIAVKDLTLTVTTPDSSAAFGLDTRTLAQLRDDINASGLATVALISADYGDLLARGLYENVYEAGETPYLDYPQSLLWAEMMAYGWALDDLSTNTELALRQLNMLTAIEGWLDDWGNRFGVPRLQSESDTDYLARIKATVLLIKQNGRALEKLIRQAVGFRVDIHNLGTVVDGVFLMNDLRYTMNTVNDRIMGSQDTPRPYRFGVYLYQNSINDLAANAKLAITGIINKYKAAGTAPVYFAPAARLMMNRPDTIMNDPAYCVGPAPGGWAEITI